MKITFILIFTYVLLLSSIFPEILLFVVVFSVSVQMFHLHLIEYDVHDFSD